MASEVASQDLNGTYHGSVNGGTSRLPKAQLSVLNTASTVQPPPSPPATDTESEAQGPSSTNNHLPPRIPTEELDTPVVSPVQSPPYWHQAQFGHARTISTSSIDSIPAGGITLQDNEASNARDDRGRGCWAKSVEVTDYTVVNGSATNIGAFVVYSIKVETLSGSRMNIRKRYSEFDDFRRRLVMSFPRYEAAVPDLPPKSIISKFRPQFLEKRRAGLQYFLNCILLNPEFSGSPVLREFLFS